MKQPNINLHFTKPASKRTIGMTLTSIKVSVPSSTPMLNTCIDKLKTLKELKEVISTPTETMIEFKLKCYRFIPSIESFESEFCEIVAKVNRLMEESGFGLFEYHFTLTGESSSVSNIKEIIDPQIEYYFWDFPDSEESLNLGTIRAEHFFEFLRILYRGCSIKFTIPKTPNNQHKLIEALKNSLWETQELLELEDTIEITATFENLEFIGSVDYIFEILTTLRTSLDSYLEEFGITNIPFHVTPYRVSPATV